MAFESDPVIVHVAQSGEAEHLVATRICENRAVPAHERVQTMHLLKQVKTRPEVKMVRIAEHHLCSLLLQFFGGLRLDRAIRPDGHEKWRLYLAATGGDDGLPGQ